MKKFLAIILAMTMVMALVACGGNNSSSNDSASAPAESTDTGAAPAEDAGTATAAGSVYWLNFKPELDETAQKLAGMYTEKTGVPVKVVTAASGTYQQTLTAEIDKSNPPTLCVIGNSAGVKDWGEYAMDLTGTAIANELNTDAYNLYDEDGRLVSIGYCY
ncbi:MAG: extracellular solute-binding protein, partial [Oscillospiraceae bacterium]|nr:extracellular solute-binding protein [Oscillospiraceae bacterium]